VEEKSLRNHSKILFYFLSAFISFSLSAQEAEKKSRELFLVRDVPQSLSFDYDIGEIAIGNPAVVSVVADRAKKRVVMSPLEAGETALLVFDTTGKQRDSIQITVTSADLDQFVKDLRFMFRDIEGLQFRRVGRKVIIEGEVYLKSDLDRIHEVLRGNDFVVDLVSLSQDTQRILARRIKDEIGESGVDVTTSKDRIVLKGEVLSEEASQRAEKLAQIYVDKANIVNALTINPKKAGAKFAKLIQVSAYFVELNKSFMRNFSFAWTPIANTQLSYDSQSGRVNFLAIVTEFFPKLNTAKALGVARVFENPTVSVKSGESAKIFSGVELSVPVSDGRGGFAQSQPKQVGVTLDVTPAADERDFVDLKIAVDVSKLGSSPTANSVLTTESRINTVQYVRSGETIAIGGILRSAFTDSKDVPPTQPFQWQPLGSGDQPGVTSSFGNIFQIFKSRASSMDRTMIVVFVTPEILVSARDSSRSLKEQMNLHNLEVGSTQNGEGFE
jgi:Flp pilus assembly secretin CpaC